MIAWSVTPVFGNKIQFPRVPLKDASSHKSPDSGLLQATGLNGQLTVLDRSIRISRKGVRAFITQGVKGDKEIQISSISSIQWKPAGLVFTGYIQFAFHGGNEAKQGIFQAVSDENSIMFTKNHEPQFVAVRDAIQQRLDQRDKGASASTSMPTADEIRKLAQLRDEGILTDEEFHAKKRQLLGL